MSIIFIDKKGILKGTLKFLYFIALNRPINGLLYFITKGILTNENELFKKIYC